MMNIPSRTHARPAAIHCKSHDQGAIDIQVRRTNHGFSGVTLSMRLRKPARSTQWFRSQWTGRVAHSFVAASLVTSGSRTRIIGSFRLRKRALESTVPVGLEPTGCSGPPLLATVSRNRTVSRTNHACSVFTLPMKRSEAPTNAAHRFAPTSVTLATCRAIRPGLFITSRHPGSR